MAISDIPLNWEMLALVGAACTAVAAGAWVVGRASSQSEARALKVENDFLRLRLNLAEADADKYKAGVQELQQRMVELSTEYARLVVELKTTAASRADSEGTQQKLELVTDLQGQLQRYSGLRDAVVAGTEEDVWNLLEKKPPPDFARRMRESRLKVVMANG